MKFVREKLGLTEEDFDFAPQYFREATTTEDHCRGLRRSTTPHDTRVTRGTNKEQKEQHKSRTNIWNEDWEKLHLVCAIADDLEVLISCLSSAHFSRFR